MNFCVTDGETVIATRYVSSRRDEAASLWFSSGTSFSEYAEGGHYRMFKEDKRENIIMVSNPDFPFHDARLTSLQIASEPLTFERGKRIRRFRVSSTQLMARISADWMEIKTNTMCIITPKMNLLMVSTAYPIWSGMPHVRLSPGPNQGQVLRP